MAEVLLIRNIQAYDVSGKQNALIVGSPSPATICGASLALCRKINVDFISVAFVIHEFSLNPGHAKFVSNDPRKRAASTVDVVTGDIRLSLMIAMNRRDPMREMSDPDDLDRESHDLNQMVRRHLRNVAGGRVIVPPTLADISIHANDVSALRSLRQMGGSMLLDRSDLLEGYSDALEAIVARQMIPDDGQDERPEGWIVPIHIGFQGIEPPTVRPADRKRIGDTIPHAFVECISSLGQYVSVRWLLIPRHCHWRYRYDPTERTYFVTAR